MAKKENKSLVLQAFERRPRDVMRTAELVTYTGYSRETVNKHLHKLMDDGRIKKQKIGYYQYLMNAASDVLRQVERKRSRGIKTKLARQPTVPAPIDGIGEIGAHLTELTMEIEEIDGQLQEMVGIRNERVKEFQSAVAALSQKMYGTTRHIGDQRKYDPDRRTKVLAHFQDGEPHRVRDIVRKFERDDITNIQQAISQMFHRGILERVDRGVYRLKGES